MSLKASFISHLRLNYPDLQEDVLQNAVSDQLLSPFSVSLKSEQLDSIKAEIQSYWQLRDWGIKNLNTEYEKYGLGRPQNYSVCMSYDFHINADGKPELIEINTNAAFLALGLELYRFLKKPTLTGFSIEQLTQMFLDEMQLCSPQRDLSVCLVDEKPEQQRLYVEFLLYAEMFRRHQIRADIADISELDKIRSAALVYNRYTDFYLQSESSIAVKKIFNENLNFSPNPQEYFLLADKQRQIDWNLQTEIPLPKSLLPVYDLAVADKEEIWSKRKNLFIKPKRSFGSKQAYKAASMSRRMFDEVCNSDFIAQQLSVPSEIEALHEGVKTGYKYDLRCFAYRDELQLVIARLYQGQTTNLRTPGGGFAVVEIKN